MVILKKRLNIPANLYEMLQILSLTMFEKIPLDQLLAKSVAGVQVALDKRLNLFE
ncbi:MAG: hypothetical protein H0X47_19565 [Nitrospirales bacterium]|nr:hypothetical protein [Nitrospirales bacterium]